MALSIAPFSADKNNKFDDFYAIYCLSFPSSEQKPKEALQAMCESENYTIFTAYDNETIVGFCILFHPMEASFYLLEYIGVAPEKRGHGIGQHLFTIALKHLYQSQGIKPLLIEIDSTKIPSHENALRVKRELFYRKLGCRKLEPFTYILGLKSATDPILMEILVYHPTLEHIAKSMLHEWLETLYTLVYACERTDPRIEQMLTVTPKTLHLI
ncbi:MAG: GNAT family N-acetyltransferase [Sulfurospirillaceae bacterium]|nr:GNAT family N-acetyltransferase [Sulfurospirillaceae bacterium]